MTDAKSVPVTFQLGELWLLHDFVRHECPQIEQWKWPPADESLNGEISSAIDACNETQLKEYTLFLSYGDCLLVDYWIRPDQKNGFGATGKSILIKIFRARAQLAFGIPLADDETGDHTYKEVRGNADNESDDLTYN